MSFLTAEWRKLIMANYTIEPALLQEYLPPFTELDPWDGNHFVSLIGFMFKRVRLLGMPIPFHINFEEVNLRFYVRRIVDGKWRRGVVFIKEIVPKPAISWVANTLYGEAYETRRMKHHWQIDAKEQLISYEWKVGKQWQQLSVKATTESQVIQEDSHQEYITEHYWGYNKLSDQKTTEYEVTHPKWQAYPVSEYQIDVDFEFNYGSKFRFLNDQDPYSVLLVEGSPITIESQDKLTSKSHLQQV
ncbi:MAG: DUF2071 domain-containing protein [Bacteroidota bacterium]